MKIKPANLTTFRLRPVICSTLRRFLPSDCSTYCQVRLRRPRVEYTTSRSISPTSLRNVARYAGYLRTTIVATASLAALFAVVPPAAAGGSFGLHVGSAGFGVSVGIGDWGPYTSNWTNPRWSLNFNAALSGYGEWMWVGGLGKVWRPGVAVGWRPYTHGRWVHTIAGWTWVAYEPWGYIPHHYGNWALCDFGWVWIPGYSYSCANVVWVRAGGYVGWYARPPRGWSHSAHGYRHGYDNGYRDGWHDARHATYVDWHHLGSDNVSHYAVRHKVASRSRVEDHAATPTVGEVRRHGGATITEARLSRRNITVNGRQVVAARPEGVARSIERHASGTAAATLSPAALDQRQPLVRTSSRSRSTDPGLRVRTRTSGSFRNPAVDNRLSSGADKVPPASANSRTGVRATPRTRIGKTVSSTRIERRFPERGSSAPDPSIRRPGESAGSHDRRAEIAIRSRPATVQPKADSDPRPGKDSGDSKPRVRRRISTKEQSENQSTEHPGRRSRQTKRN